MAIWPTYPCRNPHCKNYGSPHPNCHCSGPMAEGGDVENFCSKDQTHDSNCEYFAEGGEASPEFVPDSQFVPDTAPSAAQDFIPDDKFVPDAPKTNAKAGDSADFIPDDQFQSDDDKYGTPGQEAITALEGAAQGVAGPLATYGETHLLGVKPEDIAGRKAANPWIHGGAEAATLAGGLLTGTGEAGLVAHLAEHVIPIAQDASFLARAGSTALRGGIENGLFQSSDEISNAMLGQGDPNEPVGAALAHVGAASLLGAVGGGLFSVAGQGLDKAGNAILKTAEEKQVGTKVYSFMTGMGVGSKGAEPFDRAKFDLLKNFYQEQFGDASKLDYQSFNNGQKFVQQGLETGVEKGASEIGKFIGASHGPVGYAIGSTLAKPIEHLIGKPLSWATKKYTIPAVTRILGSGEHAGMYDALNVATQYGSAVSKGAQKMEDAVSSLFQAGSQQAVDKEGMEADREKLKKFIQTGGLQQQLKTQSTIPTYADGGEVAAESVAPEATDSSIRSVNQAPITQEPVIQQANPLETHFPEQSMLLNVARGRIDNYLTGLKPVTPPKLPYDVTPSQKTSERSFDRALDVANHPLSIFDHIKKGTITPEHVQHFSAMYPELKAQLQKKIGLKIVESQVKEEKPLPYSVRQGLSLFLGQPLDSTLTPQGIQTAQAVQQSSQAPQGPQLKGGGNGKSGSLKNINKLGAMYQTPLQAHESNSQAKD